MSQPAEQLFEYTEGALTEHSRCAYGGLQAVKGEAGDIVRVFLQTPTGCCHVDITRAVLHRHIQVRLHCQRLMGFHTPLLHPASKATYACAEGPRLVFLTTP